MGLSKSGMARKGMVLASRARAGLAWAWLGKSGMVRGVQDRQVGSGLDTEWRDQSLARGEAAGPRLVGLGTGWLDQARAGWTSRDGTTRRVAGEGWRVGQERLGAARLGKSG